MSSNGRNSEEIRALEAQLRAEVAEARALDLTVSGGPNLESQEESLQFLKAKACNMYATCL